jgi:hypothetical protein
MLDARPGSVSTTTNYAGHYQFEVTRGCYFVVFNAPPGTIFVGGGSEDRQHVCMDRGQTDVSIDAVLVHLTA